MSIPIADIKKYLRYDADDSSQDDPLGIIVAGAQNWVEKHTHKALADYADPDEVPPVMIQAICLIVGMNDADRANLGDGMSAVEWLLADYHRPGMA